MTRILLSLILLGSVHGIAAEVNVVRVPNGGIQPQAVVGEDGSIHLIYFKGEPANGNLFYVSRPSSSEQFTKPIRVNQQPQSAVAMGTIRGAQVALGQNDRVHVAWMGSGKTAKKVDGKHPEHPMFYTRLNESGTDFEQERNVMTWTGGLDGGGSVAADSLGNVFVAWHGSSPDNSEDEMGRAMFVAESRDGGRTFSKEVRANAEPTGSCGCCGMRAFVDRQNQVHLLYRSANKISRDMTLLTSSDHGKTYRTRTVNKWFTQSCPMSSSSMANSPEGLLIATEVAGVLELRRLGKFELSPIKLADLSPAKAKHASVTTNQRGEILAAWAEGAGWSKGGELNWKLLDANGKPIGDQRSAGDLPNWSFPTVVATKESGFVIIF